LAQIHAARGKSEVFRGLNTLIRLGIVGSNYGRTVHLPAFRMDKRCEVMALAASSEERAHGFAREAGVARGYGDWRALVDDPDVDAVAIATMPALQAQVAMHALKLGKPVFAEKPMASTLADARAMLDAARQSGRPAMIDFNFTQIMAWLRAKEMLDAGAVGTLRHMAVHWQVENRAVQMRMKNWKTLTDDGGGVLGNFISHSFHYVEWFCEPIVRLTARLGGLPGENEVQTTVAMALELQSGPLVSVSMSCASWLGSGHRLEFYGEDGTLVLHNRTADYMRGFELFHARRPAAALEQIAIDDPADAGQPDGRIAPVSRLANLFFDAIEGGGTPKPGFAEGYRVQQLIDAAQRSHREAATVRTAPGEIEV
jgi:predicted dehydrogenase